MMRFRLSTLLIWLAIGPPVVATAWLLIRAGYGYPFAYALAVMALVLIAWWASAWAVLLALGFRRNPDFTPKPARFQLQTLMLAMLIVPAAYVAICWVCAMAGPFWVLTCDALGID